MSSYILKAFGFLFIKYDEGKPNMILYYLPIMLSILICVFLSMLNCSSTETINIFTEKAFDSISTFVQVLPGFFIASLSAIASYGNENIDNKMSGNPPYLLEITERGKYKSELSRRRFLTLMFGYLSAISMIITIFLFLIRLSYDVQILTVPSVIYFIVYYLVSFIFFYIFFQIITITLYGIYYLADRMYLP